ncbi:hypothetical protein ASD06_02385 [Angustibacter sp. Root456]|nr:hypothetical protein ASD06_02385 [Angustibacter sp. Root456]
MPWLAEPARRFWAAQRTPAPTWVLATSAGVGCAAGGLVAGHRPGLGFALAGLLVWAVAAPNLLRHRAFGQLWLASLSVLLCGVVALRDAAWVASLSVLAAMGTAAVAATSARSAGGVLLSAPAWVAGAVRAVPWLGRRANALSHGRSESLVRALGAVSLTALLLVVFGALFASADAVFASYLPRPDLHLLPAQAAVALLASVACATNGQLVSAPPPTAELRAPAGGPSTRWAWALPVTALAALVWAFVLVQVAALVGGHRYVDATAGLTYAEYTRQGFAQLVVATALTLVVVAVAVRHAPRASAADRLVVRASLGALCVGTLGVVASALRRVDLYVEAFGLTRLRLLVVFGEVALGAIVVLVLVAGVRWSGGWLPRAVVGVASVSMLALAAVNPDAQIVRYNASATAQGRLDVTYLQGLSADAVPAADALAEPMRSCVLAGLGRYGPQEVAGWNFGRARARAAGVPTSSGLACTNVASAQAAQNDRR